MTKENLPEEKLLKLIRSKKTDKEKPFSASGKTKKSFDISFLLSAVNGLLMVTVLASAGFLAYRIFFVPAKEVKTVTAVSAPQDSLAQKQVNEDAPEKRPFEYYKNQFLKRDLFERPLDQVAANASVDLTKRYKLVGIVLGDEPEAIIEDLTTRNTVFVHQGEYLDAVEVKKIEEGRVVFLQEGLEIELKQ